MASPPPTAGSTPGPPSPATRVPTERSAPARVAAENSRRGATEERGACPTSRHDGGSRSGDGDATNGGGRSRGTRNDEREEGGRSEDDGDNEESKVDPERARRGPLTSDEFALISVPLDTWVGRYVRITTPRHNGTTGLVHRTGNGWVNLQTALGDVAKRAYDLVVIPEERANINGGNNGLEKGESRGKRYRAKAPAGASVGSTSGSGDERKAAASRVRNTRTSAPPAHSSSDSSGQDDNEEDGDEHDNGRSIRRRGRGPMDDGSEFEDADQDDDEDDDLDNDDQRYHDDNRMRNNARGGRSFPSSNGKGRSMAKCGGREKGDRYVGGEPGKQPGRMIGKYGGRDSAAGKSRGRVGEHDKMRERERGRGEPSKGGGGRDRDGIKGDSFVPLGKGRERDSDAGSSRGKRRDLANSLVALGDSEDRMAAVSRDRVDRSKDKPGAPGAGKKDDAAIKPSWAAQMQKAKERPNLGQWRDELVAITKDSSEDFEDATLSVELMRARCDVCYHEKADGDKFCWNDQCWMSPVFTGYFKSDEDRLAPVEAPAPQRVGYFNTFGRETIIDPALTSSLQAPVKWIETKRKRELEAHEVFSEDPALYRWQCWASNYKDPNSKDPTFVEDPRVRNSDGKRVKYSSGHARSMSASRLSPESKHFRAYDDKRDPGELDEMDSGPPRSGGGGGASGLMDEASSSHKVGHAGDDDSRVSAYANEDGRVMESGGEGDESMRMDEEGARHGVSHRGDARSGRRWA